MLLDGLNSVLEENLGGEGVSVVHHWFPSIPIPAVHCVCVYIKVKVSFSEEVCYSAADAIQWDIFKMSRKC